MLEVELAAAIPSLPSECTARERSAYTWSSALTRVVALNSRNLAHSSIPTTRLDNRHRSPPSGPTSLNDTETPRKSKSSTPLGIQLPTGRKSRRLKCGSSPRLASASSSISRATELIRIVTPQQAHTRQVQQERREPPAHAPWAFGTKVIL